MSRLHRVSTDLDREQTSLYVGINADKKRFNHLDLMR